MMPPRRLRRPVTITAWSAVAVTCVVLSPVLLLLAWLASTLSRRPQPMVFARLIVAYLSETLLVLAACGLLWVVSAGGRRIEPRRSRFHDDAHRSPLR